MLVFASALVFVNNKIIVKNLIVDAVSDKIVLKVIAENESYTNEYSNNSENFDKISIIIFEFLKSNNIKIADISNIFVNHGPGKFSTLRSSIVICKALSLSNNIDFYGLSSKQMENINYNKLLDLLEKGALIRNIIKPVY